tara:strand:- start:429 stop:1133 length:705 start_codon:yes stop_codon:yes gene_type:complete
MKLNLKALLKNKTVLYVVLVLAVVNLFGYLMTRNFNAVIFMLAVGIVSANFSKNMIVILGVSLLATSFAVGNGLLGSVFEGLENKNTKQNKNTKKNKKEGLSPLRPKAIKKVTAEDDSDEENEDDTVVGADESEQKGASGGHQSNIDYAATLEKAYDNLDTLLSSDAINKMSDETERLGHKQNKLMKNIDKLEPMMQKAGGILEKFDMEGMMGKMEGLMDGLGNLNGKNKKEKN